MSSWMSLKNFYLLNFTSVYYKNILPYILPIYFQNILPNTQTVATWHFSDLDPGFQSNKPNEGNIYSWQGLSLCELCLKFKPIYHLLICFSFQITRKKKIKSSKSPVYSYRLIQDKHVCNTLQLEPSPARHRAFHAFQMLRHWCCFHDPCHLGS